MDKFIHVKGFDQLQKFLDQLPVKMEKGIMRAALRDGAKVVLAEVEASAPVRSGLLQAGFRSKKDSLSTDTKNGVVVAKVKASGKHAFLAPWIEYGTAAHLIKPKDAKALSFGGVQVEVVHHPGASPKPFMRPALDNKAGDALRAVGEGIKKRLTKKGLDVSGVDLGD